MVHHFMTYRNTTQKDTKLKFATQGNHQCDKSLKERRNPSSKAQNIFNLKIHFDFI